MTIELLTTATFLLSTFYGATPVPEKTGADFEVSFPETRQTTLVDKPLTLEQYVRNYFKDAPILAEIARCESRFRHLDKNGIVLRGEMTVEDLGIMQINEFYHEDTAKALGLNLRTLDGNLAYAKWLYAKEGVTPWFSSSKCWQQSDTLAKANIWAATN